MSALIALGRGMKAIGLFLGLFLVPITVLADCVSPVDPQPYSYNGVLRHDTYVEGDHQCITDFVPGYSCRRCVRGFSHECVAGEWSPRLAYRCTEGLTSNRSEGDGSPTSNTSDPAGANIDENNTVQWEDAQPDEPSTKDLIVGQWENVTIADWGNGCGTSTLVSQLTIRDGSASWVQPGQTLSCPFGPYELTTWSTEFFPEFFDGGVRLVFVRYDGPPIYDPFELDCRLANERNLKCTGGTNWSYLGDSGYVDFTESGDFFR